MKNLIVPAALFAVILAIGISWYIEANGPQRVDDLTRTQHQFELDKLASEARMLRVMLDGEEAPSVALITGYARQLASLAANPEDTQEHRDMVQMLTQGIETEQAKIDAIKERRRTELKPLEQRVIAMQRQVASRH